MDTIKQEQRKHKEAFEMYYVMGDDRSMRKLAKALNISLTTINNWAQSFDWTSRIEVRDSAIGKELERKTNETVVEMKAKYHTFLKGLIARAIEDFKNKHLGIEDVDDLIKVMKLDLELLGEGGGSSGGYLDDLNKAIGAGMAMFQAQQAAAPKEGEE